MQKILFALLLAATVSAIGCGGEDPKKKEEAAKKKADSLKVVAEKVKADSVAKAEAAKPKNLVETAVAAGNFKTLVELATAAGLAETLGKEEVTVFAPTDEAFAKVDAKVLEGLKKDPKKLAEVLKLHVVAGKVMAADVKPGKVKTLAGKDVTVAVKDGKVTVNKSNVTATDIKASNGVIHVVDAVIM